MGPVFQLEPLPRIPQQVYRKHPTVSPSILGDSGNFISKNPQGIPPRKHLRFLNHASFNFSIQKALRIYLQPFLLLPQ